MGGSPTPQELDAVMFELDSNGDAVVDFPEFLTKFFTAMDEEELLRVFKQLFVLEVGAVCQMGWGWGWGWGVRWRAPEPNEQGVGGGGSGGGGGGCGFAGVARAKRGRACCGDGVLADFP